MSSNIPTFTFQHINLFPSPGFLTHESAVTSSNTLKSNQDICVFRLRASYGGVEFVIKIYEPNTFKLTGNKSDLRNVVNFEMKTLGERNFPEFICRSVGFHVRGDVSYCYQRIPVEFWLKFFRIPYTYIILCCSFDDNKFTSLNSWKIQFVFNIRQGFRIVKRRRHLNKHFDSIVEHRPNRKGVLLCNMIFNFIFTYHRLYKDCLLHKFSISRQKYFLLNL